MVDMDGNRVIMEGDMDDYGQEMDDQMDPEQMIQERPGPDDGSDDELGFDEFEDIITRQEDEAKDQIAELRAANFIEKGKPIWFLQQSIKTGDQAISFFAKHGSNMPIKFINCNRRKVALSQFRPYDLVTVEDDKKLDPEYFTVSAQGVVQLFNDKSGRSKSTSPTEFLSLPEWMQQSTMFNVLTSMKFFKNYLIGKVFSQWKGNVRKRDYNRTREQLSRDLIYVRPDYIQEFMTINQTLYEMSSRLTFDVEKKQGAATLDDFKEKQGKNHEEAKSFYKTKVDEEIKNTLVGLTKKVSESRTLREEEDLENTKKGKAEKKKSIVLQKEENKLKNQVLRLARRNFRSLGTFIRLIDYRVVETQVRIN
jgi:dynein heavy chain